MSDLRMEYTDDPGIQVRMQIFITYIRGQHHDVGMSMGIDSVLTAPNIVTCKVYTKNLMGIDMIINDNKIDAVSVCEYVGVMPCKASKDMVLELGEKILQGSIRIYEIHILKTNLRYMPGLHDFLEAMVPGRFLY